MRTQRKRGRANAELRLRMTVAGRLGRSTGIRGGWEGSMVSEVGEMDSSGGCNDESSVDKLD